MTLRNAAGVLTAAQTASAEASREVERSTTAMTHRMRAILSLIPLAFPAARLVFDSPVSPRKLPLQERSRRTVERILDAAARIFHEQGYAAATTNDIADEADVSV